MSARQYLVTTLAKSLDTLMEPELAPELKAAALESIMSSLPSLLKYDAQDHNLVVPDWILNYYTGS